MQAHRQGILTSASLMVSGAAFAEAVQIARENPRLGVGLHLTLVCGHSILDCGTIPGVVDANQSFTQQPVRAGLRYFFSQHLRSQLAREIQAQLDKFSQTGLVLDHINGHLNMHLHPTVLRLLLNSAAAASSTGFRLTRDPLWTNLRIASGRWGYRLSHALVFSLLARWAKPRLPTSWAHTQAVFGLLQTSRINESYLADLLPRLDPGCYELYSHPSIDTSPSEAAALTSSKITSLVKKLGIQLIRYQDMQHV